MANSPTQKVNIAVTAALAERVLREPDGVLSLIRIVDKLTLSYKVEGAAPDVDVSPATLSGLSLAAQMAVFLRQISGPPGKHEVKIELVDPNGRRIAFTSIEVPMSVSEGGQVVIPLMLAVEKSGRYRFDVRLDGRVRTQLPIEVEIIRLDEHDAPSE